MKRIVVGILFFFHFAAHSDGFIAGTMVKTPLGYVPIEHLNPGDLVVCYDGKNSYTTAPITAIHQRKLSSYCIITVNGEPIGLSFKQRLYFPLEKRWIKAEELKQNDTLYQFHTHLISIDDIRDVQEATTVFDITVADYHNFCVSHQNIHAHNFAPAVVLGLGWAFGGGIEFVGATLGLALFGTVINVAMSKDKNKQESKIDVSIGNGGSGPSGDPEDPDKKKRPKPSSAELQKLAHELGYKKIKDHPFNSHGQEVFKKGNKYITYDIDGHKGGFWKLFQGNQRLGTFDQTLNIRIGN